jgi:hypothetical protein
VVQQGQFKPKTVSFGEYKNQKRSIGDSMMLNWLEYFAKKTPAILKPPR